MVELKDYMIRRWERLSFHARDTRVKQWLIFHQRTALSRLKMSKITKQSKEKKKIPKHGTTNRVCRRISWPSFWFPLWRKTRKFLRWKVSIGLWLYLYHILILIVDEQCLLEDWFLACPSVSVKVVAASHLISLRLSGWSIFDIQEFSWEIISFSSRIPG